MSASFSAIAMGAGMRIVTGVAIRSARRSGAIAKPEWQGQANSFTNEYNPPTK
jgi:hypothetical protein